MSATLTGKVREKLGSRWARRLRLQNQIPVSIQGEGKPNLDASIDVDEFATARRHDEHLFDIEFEGQGPETVMVRELQWDSFGDHIIHVEFRRVVRGQKTEAEVELEFVGHVTGGVLNHLMTHITVSCLPSQIPGSIEVRVDGLEPGHPLLLRDVELPEGLEAVGDPEDQVAVVSQVRAVVEETEAEAQEGEAAPEAAPASEEPPSEG